MELADETDRHLITAPNAPYSDQSEYSIRAAMFDHLDNLQTSGPGESLPSSMINTFSFLGRFI